MQNFRYLGAAKESNHFSMTNDFVVKHYNIFWEQVLALKRAVCVAIVSIYARVFQ